MYTPSSLLFKYNVIKCPKSLKEELPATVVSSKISHMVSNEESTPLKSHALSMRLKHTNPILRSHAETISHFSRFSFKLLIVRKQTSALVKYLYINSRYNLQLVPFTTFQR